MAAAETARLIASLELKDNMSKGINSATASLGKLESRGFRVGQTIGKGINTAASNIARLGVIAGGVAIVGLTKSVQAASNLEQAIGAVDSVFGKSAKTIEAWGNNAAEAAGLSKREVNEMAAVTGAQLQGMGFEVEDAAKQAVVLQKRAADLAATFGGPTADAMNAISSLMRGERDPIERYGVSIKAVDITARIAAKGLDTSTAAAKKNAEAIAGMELLMEQTANTQGQFAREADGLAGSQARLRANLENTGAIIGKTLLPQLAKLTGKFNDLLVANQPAIAKFAEQLPAVFDQILAAVERIPWEGIGASLQLAGTGAKAILDAFLGAPAWLQTAVLTGWGLNKLTGGAVIDLGKIGLEAAFDRFAARGASPANPLFVSDVAGGIGGAAGAAGKTGLLGTLLKGVFPAAVILGIGTAIGSAVVDAMGGPLTAPEQQTGTGRVVGDIAGLEIVMGQNYGALVRNTDAIKRQTEIAARGVKGNEVFGPPKPTAGTADSGLGGRNLRSTFGEEAILARAIAKGFKPTDAAVQATLQRNMIREQEKTKAAIDAVKTQEGRTTAGVLLTAAAVQNMDRQKPPSVSTSVVVNVTAASVTRSIVVQNRAGPASGSRHAPGTGPLP